jgi:hypothetical protein
MIHKVCSYPATRTAWILALILGFASVAASAPSNEQVLYSFQSGTDGSFPIFGVVSDEAGNLYGATLEGGATNCNSIYPCGTVYQLTQNNGVWVESVLYIFKGEPEGDGASPFGGLVIDSSGNLYGTTAYGGTGSCVLLGEEVGCGTVFELSPPLEQGGFWKEAVLYSFPTSAYGYLPWGQLTSDSAGNLYGATQFGGGRGTTCNSFYQYCGEVFELSPPKNKGGNWEARILHSFGSGTDGANPNGGLFLDSNGVLYGTTVAGGYDCPHHSGEGCGTVFALAPPAGNGDEWTETQLHVFQNGSDGTSPIAGVTVDSQGFVYGGAQGGDNGEGNGIIFRLAPNGGTWKQTILHSFGSDVFYYGPAVSYFDTQGYLYGTTNAGQNIGGSVFRMKQSDGKWSFDALHVFSGGSDSGNPGPVLTADKSGHIYGTTQNGGSGTACQGGCGTVFEISP